jgi:hypothetical protein
VKLQDLHEGEVIKAKFGKGVFTPKGIDVPQGFDRFEVDHREGDTVAHIVGIKPNGSRVRISTTSSVEGARQLVKHYNGEKTDVDIKPVSPMRAFGSAELADLSDAGISLAEKPDYWESLEPESSMGKKYAIDQLKLKRIEKIVGYKPEEYDSAHIFGYSGKPRGTSVKVKTMPEEQLFIVKFNDGSRYLADRTGAKTYIRFWAKIV